jgi:hypothetical protein
MHWSVDQTSSPERAFDTPVEQTGASKHRVAELEGKLCEVRLPHPLEMTLPICRKLTLARI